MERKIPTNDEIGKIKIHNYFKSFEALSNSFKEHFKDIYMILKNEIIFNFLYNISKKI